MKYLKLLITIPLFLCCGPTYKSQLQTILPDEYCFKVISYEKSNLYYFEGINKDGKREKYEIQLFWEIDKYCNEGDSIIKRKGEKEIMVIKTDTIIHLRFWGQDGPLYPEEQDSIFRELTKKDTEQ